MIKILYLLLDAGQFQDAGPAGTSNPLGHHVLWMLLKLFGLCSIEMLQILVYFFDLCI